MTKDEKLLWQSLNALDFASDYLDALSEKMFGGPKKPKNGGPSWHVQQAIAALRERLREQHAVHGTVFFKDNHQYRSQLRFPIADGAYELVKIENPDMTHPLTKLQRKAIAVCFTSDKVSVSEVQRKLSISYADAQTLCQSIVDLGLTDELELAPSLKQRGAPAPQAAPVAQGNALPREDFAWMVVQEACETEPADEDDPECIRILRRDLKSAVLAAFLREDAARAQQEHKP